MRLPKTRTQFRSYEVPVQGELPSVVLVGRPNVGKSLLFNRLTQSKEALVADFPGLTRDRLYGLGRLGQQAYLVIDTGGLGVADKSLDALMSQQVQCAIQEASHIFMVVDARAGLMSEDQLIAQQLRKSHKSISLIVNKAEGLASASSEFFQLGLGVPHPISALHNQGITSLIESLQLFSKTSVEQTPPLQTQAIKIAMIGRPNAGKSTLMNRLLGQTRSLVSEQPGTTRDSVAARLEHRGAFYTLIDTAGIRRQARIEAGIERFSVIKSLQAVQASQVVLLLIDASAGITDQDLHLLQFVIDAGRALVVVINKWDGLSSTQRRQIRVQLQHRLRFVSFAKICFISALHGTGVGDLFLPIQQAYTSATQSVSTAHLTRLLQQAVETHTPPIVQGRTIKLRYAHPGGHNPPVILIHGRHTQLVPETYRRYLAHFYQRALKSVGTPLRVIFKEST